MATTETTKTGTAGKTVTLPPRQFAEGAIGRIKLPESGRLQIADTVAAGLWLRISASGVRSWSALYRVHGGPVQRLTIGRWPAVGVKAARQRAREIIATAGKGEDPAPRRAPVAAAPTTFGEAASEWLKRSAEPRQPRSLSQTEGQLARHLLPVLGSRPIRQIRKHDLLALIDTIQDRGHLRAANKTVGLLRRIFRWALERDLIDVDPAAGLRPPAPEISRDRVLEDHELAAVWNGAGRLDWPVRQFIRLLILTGQRRTEVAAMAWAEIDFGSQLWRLPSERSKTGRPHTLPLSGPALEILRDLPELVGNPYVLPSNRTSPQPIVSYTRIKTRIDRASGVTGWRLHDLRRTTATGLARLGVEPHVISRILNHSAVGTMGITAIYNRFSYDEAARIGLERWAAHVLDLVAGRPANVVPLAGRGA